MGIDRGVKVENLTFSNFFVWFVEEEGCLVTWLGTVLTLVREDDISALLVWLCCQVFVLSF